MMKLKNCNDSQNGQSIVEYAMVIVLVAIAVVIAVNVFGEELKSAYCGVVNAFGGENCQVSQTAELPCDFQFEEGFSFEEWKTAGGSGQTVTTEDGYAVFTGDGRGQMLYENACTDAYQDNDIAILANDVTVESSTGKGVPTFTIVFRAQDYANNYKFTYYPPPTNVMLMWSQVEGRHVLLGSARTPSEFFNQPNDFEIRIIGEDITVYMNSVQMMQGHDDKFKEGTVGIANGPNDKTKIGSFLVKPIK